MRAVQLVLGSIALAAAIGAVVAVVAFGLTSMHRNLIYLGAVCWEYTSIPSIDSWTGEWVAGQYLDHSVQTPPFDCSAPGKAYVLEPPSDLADMRAVPLPVGFMLGATVALIATLPWSTHPPPSTPQLGRHP